MAVSVNIDLRMTTTETLTFDGLSSTSNKIRYTGLNESSPRVLNATSTPAVTMHAIDNTALVAGAKTIDLTSLPGLNGSTQDGTGLKVQAIRIKNTGATSLNVAPGASNGYDLFGAGNDLTIPAGSEIIAYLPEGTPDVASGDRTLDFAGTGTATFSYEVWLG